jgi:hypothetical protein
MIDNPWLILKPRSLPCQGGAAQRLRGSLGGRQVARLFAGLTLPLPPIRPMSTSVSTRAIDPNSSKLHEAFATDGYLILEQVVAADALATLHDAILSAFERERASGRLFDGGGLLSGHLNCFPGAESRFVYQVLEERGVIALVKALMPRAVRLPNVGCNVNFPGSHPQNRHIDGYAAEAFPIVNIAAVDTDLVNGAMEVLPGTHRREYKYWELVLERPRPLRPMLRRGDVVVRTSALWHRGMPNNSQRARPMLALTWEDGGSQLDDPYSAHGGRISFFPNRYAPTMFGRLRERAFIVAPTLNSSVRFVRSFFV